MPSKPTIGVKGLNKLARELKKAGDTDLLDALKEANKEAADTVRQATEVPRASGKLAASLRSSATARAGVVRVGKASLPYAGPVHFGWPKRNIEPQPFLYEALDARRDEVINLYENRIKRVLDSIEGGGD